MDLCDRRHLSGPANCPAGITSMDGFATGSRRAGPRNLLDQLRLGRNDVLPSGASKLTPMVKTLQLLPSCSSSSFVLSCPSSFHSVYGDDCGTKNRRGSLNEFV